MMSRLLSAAGYVLQLRHASSLSDSMTPSSRSSSAGSMQLFDCRLVQVQLRGGDQFT
jgi:hypothetical protein